MRQRAGLMEGFLTASHPTPQDITHPTLQDTTHPTLQDTTAGGPQPDEHGKEQIYKLDY